jgi:tetratricopeptide (TPR) repeat protein
MIPATRDDQKKEAFRLFEDGRYQESLTFCQVLLDAAKDPAIEVLAATNLFLTGKLEDAEAAFLDLARKMPDSSYVHSYLAKVLEARGDEAAIAEYATAVHLDPTNQDALRSYAGYLLGHHDYHGALRVLRRLVHLGKKPADVRNLMRALIEAGEADEALATHAILGEGAEKTHEYIDALASAKNHKAAAEAACSIYRATKDPKALRKYLDALARYDLSASLEAYHSHISDTPDADILFDYILLRKSTGNLEAALAATRSLLTISTDPAHRLAECDLLAATGQEGPALAAFERLIRDELATKNNLDVLRQIIGRYREFLKNHPDPEAAKHRFLALVSKDVNVASLAETARFYEERGDTGEARSWYYRAYRADFLAGGLEYARFLIGQGEDRECEKVMLYILANVKKGSDLTRVAAAIVDEHGGMYRLKRLMEQLVKRLGERQSSLHSDGLELLAMAFFISATNALEEKDYAGCKYLCLSGMDILPTPSRALRLEAFLQLVRACKEQSVADRPIMHARPARRKADAAPVAQVLTDQLGLSEPEQKIVEFLRSHRKATEMDLRKVLGTRRVVGIVNILIQKAAAQGMSIIEKKGIGEEGEVYEYTGT